MINKLQISSISQVALPSLHISLGSYLKFFEMLEKQCYIFDFKIAAKTKSASNIDDVKLQEMIDKYSEVQLLEESAKSITETIELVHEAVATNICRKPEEEDKIRKIYEPRLEFLSTKLNEKVQYE